MLFVIWKPFNASNVPSIRAPFWAHTNSLSRNYILERHGRTGRRVFIRPLGNHLSAFFNSKHFKICEFGLR